MAARGREGTTWLSFVKEADGLSASTRRCEATSTRKMPEPNTSIKNPSLVSQRFC